jgi:uncharacterized NAD(P)/FAD-binding protein YdhS
MQATANPVERAWTSNEHTAYSVAVVGGGFGGVMTAIHLLRVLPAASEIVLFERAGRLGRGAAYGTELPCHLLNVPATRMSAFPDAPADFADWLCRSQMESSCAATDAGLFAPRAVYGDYIESLARAALRSGRLTVIPAAVTDLWPEQAGFRLAAANGRTVRAGQVVLALGNLAAGEGPAPTHVTDPWSPAALAPLDAASDRPVVVVGTGLSMVDLALGLRARGFAGRIVAISRRGLLPQCHRPSAAWPTPDFTPTERRSILALFRRVRAEIAAAAAADVDWRGVIDGVRPAVQSLWQGLPAAERRRFLRHLRPWWDIHRHRMPMPAAAALAAMREEGTLDVHAGSVLSVEPAAAGVRVTWRPRGASLPRRLDAARVIAATGTPNAAAIANPLLDALRDRGLARLDPLGLGLDVNDRLAVIDTAGRANPAIHALGPIVRGVLWECTAVPELRAQAVAIAHRIAEAFQPAEA